MLFPIKMICTINKYAFWIDRLNIFFVLFFVFHRTQTLWACMRFCFMPSVLSTMIGPEFYAMAMIFSDQFWVVVFIFHVYLLLLFWNLWLLLLIIISYIKLKRCYSTTYDWSFFCLIWKNKNVKKIHIINEW